MADTLELLFDNEVDFAEIASRPTEHKAKGATEISMPSNSADFNIPISESEPEPEYQQPKPEPVVLTPEKPYDAERNAVAMTYGVVSIRTVLLTFAAGWKAQSDFGGSASLKNMKKAAIRKRIGKELSEVEKNQAESFEEYKRLVDMLTDDIVPSDKKLKSMFRAATPYFEETQKEISPLLGFWAEVVSDTVECATKIILS